MHIYMYFHFNIHLDCCRCFKQQKTRKYFFFVLYGQYDNPTTTIIYRSLILEMSDENLAKLKQQIIQMKKQEEDFSSDITKLSNIEKEADQMLELNTSYLFSLSQLAEKQQRLDEERDNVKSELKSLRNQLILSQMKMNEVSKVAQIIIKEKEMKNPKPTDESKMCALKTTEFLQNEITKATQKCMKQENMQLDHSEIENIATNLGKVINELKKRELIIDTPQDIIQQQQKQIQMLLDQKQSNA